MIIVEYRSSRWEVVGFGCPTALQPKNCPNHPNSLTVYLLDRRGRRRPGGTSCIDATKITHRQEVPDDNR